MDPVITAQNRARQVATQVQARLSPDIVPTIGLVLHEQWAQALKLQHPCEANLRDFPGFDSVWMPSEGRVVCGDFAGVRLVALRDPVRLVAIENRQKQAEVEAAVRLQIEMMCEMGIRYFVLADVAGGLTMQTEIGRVVVTSDFLDQRDSRRLPSPLLANEEYRPEGALLSRLASMVHESASRELKVMDGKHSFVDRSFFLPQTYDGASLRDRGAKTVGMGLLPEVCVLATRSRTYAVCLSLVTHNKRDGRTSEELTRLLAKKSAPLGSMLTSLLAKIIVGTV